MPSRGPLQHHPQQDRVDVVVVEPPAGRLRDPGVAHGHGPEAEVEVVVGVQVGQARAHGEQVAQVDGAEAGVAVGQLGQVAGHGVVDRADPALGDGDPDHGRHDRLGHRERADRRVVPVALEVDLGHQRVALDGQERGGAGGPQEPLQVPLDQPAALADGHGRHRQPVGGRRPAEPEHRRAGGDGAGREPPVVRDVGLLPDDRAGQPRTVGRRPGPPVGQVHPHDQHEQGRRGDQCRKDEQAGREPGQVAGERPAAGVDPQHVVDQMHQGQGGHGQQDHLRPAGPGTNRSRRLGVGPALLRPPLEHLPHPASLPACSSGDRSTRPSLGAIGGRCESQYPT